MTGILLIMKSLAKFEFTNITCLCGANTVLCALEITEILLIWE